MKVLLFGPLTPPYNGQAAAFTTLVNSINTSNRLLINTAKYRSRLLNTFYAIVLTFYFSVFYRFSVIYFTSSRSALGFIKDLPLILLGSWSGKKIINHLHGADFKSFYNNSGLIKPLVKYVYQKVDLSIVLLDEMKFEYSDFPKMKLETVNNCYDSVFEDYLPIPDKELQLVYFSNLMKSKGILEFLEASLFLLDKHPFLKVKIAGAPLSDHIMTSDAIYLAFQTKYKKLREIFGQRIEYRGSVKGKDKLDLLSSSSIFVLPTNYPTEAFPISIIESMRSGNAIVATKHNYIPYFIKPQNGVLIPKNSVKGIIDGVDTLLLNPEKLIKIQKYNIEEARVKYCPLIYTEKIKSLIFQ